MTSPDQPSRTLTHEELPRLHSATGELARLYRSRLRTVGGADANFAELRELYFKTCGRPFDLRRELNSPLESVPTQIQLHEWEYAHEVRTERERRTVTVISPLTWVLSYPSPYTHSMARQVVAGRQEKDQESLRSFVLRACLMQLVFAKLPELTTLLEGLRFRAEIRKPNQLGELSLVTVSAAIPTVRPEDALLMQAAGLSGGTGFVEVVDLDRAMQLADPLHVQVQAILASGNPMHIPV